MTKDERERLVKVEEAVKLIPEIRDDVKLLLAAYNKQQGYIEAGAAVVASLGAMIGAAIAAFWTDIKALF